MSASHESGANETSMRSFGIHFGEEPWKLTSCKEACEKGLLVLDTLANGPQRLSFQAELPSWEAMQRLAPIVPQAVMAGYGWLPLESSRDLEKPVFRLIKQANLDFGDVRLAIEPLPYKLPSHDWDGKFPEMQVAVKLTTMRSLPLPNEALRPSLEIQAKVAELTARVSSEQPGSVKTSNQWWNGPRLAQSYEVQVSLPAAKELLKRLWVEFGLGPATGSFEIAGTTENVGEMVAGGFHFPDSPANLWPLNRGGRPFVIQPCYGLNADAATLMQAAEVIELLNDKTFRVIVTCKYLSWKLPEDGDSRRAQGNALSIWSSGGPWDLRLSFERDRKLKHRQFVPFIVKKLGQIGGTLVG